MPIDKDIGEKNEDPAAAMKQENVEVKGSGKNARILIVDDDENIRRVLVAILEDEGYMVDSVGTGKKGIEATKRKFYNMALIDIRLPDMEGTELLTQLKDTTPRMRKIIITGYPTLQNAIEAVNRRADGYVMKPFDVKKVLETIEDQLKKQEEEKTYSQSKVAEFIETRVKELTAEQQLENKNT
ncbi:MAG TPA: response regulator [Candidatus Acidoferrum sp.]|nr:response regulator [Candidatus Acidoferrum sp.]